MTEIVQLQYKIWLVMDKIQSMIIGCIWQRSVKMFDHKSYDIFTHFDSNHKN